MFAGNYGLSCRPTDDFLQQTVPVVFNFTVNTNGTSLLNGQPWLDAAHPGLIELGYQQKTGLESFVPYNLNFVPDSTTFNNVTLFWKANGTLQLANVTVAGKGYNCPAAGQVVPAATINIANADFNSVFLKKLARTEALVKCPIGGPQTLTLGSDGAAGVAGNAFAADQLFNVKDNSFKPAFTGPNAVAYAGLQYSSGFIKSFSTIRSLLIAFDPTYKTTSLAGGTGTDANGTVLGAVSCQ